MSNMTETRFREMAETFGSNLGKWPKQERPAANALLAERPELQAVLKQEQALDAALADLMADAEIAVPAAGSGPVRVERRWDLSGFLNALWPFGGFWQPAAGLAVASAAGFYIGINLTELPAESSVVYDQQFTMVEQAIGAPPQEID